MSKAVDDLLLTLGRLKELSQGLGALALGENRARSREALQLNGLHVVAFAAVEDFIRRRVIEVAAGFGKEGIVFNNFPDSTKLYFLTETIAGINFTLDRTDTAQKIDFLQHEGILMNSTSDVDAHYEPSEYIFGRSSSNISLGQVKVLFEALGLTGGLKNLHEVATAAALAHLGHPDGVYTRLSINRHRAAHGFKDDYQINQFTEDLDVGILLFAFCFDTCISQATFHIINSCKKNMAHTPFSGGNSKIKKMVFDPAKKTWNVFGNGKLQKTLKKITFDQYLDAATQTCKADGHSLIATAGAGNPIAWIQPI